MMLSLLLLAAADQAEPNTDDLPYPAYVAPGHKRPHWVLLGAADDTSISALSQNNISWMTMPPLLAWDTKDQRVLQALSGDNGYFAVEVAVEQFQAAKNVLADQDKAGKHCCLISAVTPPPILFPPPSDHDLAKLFLAKKEVFEQLRTMFLKEKGLNIVGDDWTDPRDPSTIHVSPERIDQYRSLARQVAPSCRLQVDRSSGDFDVTEWTFGAVPTEGFMEEICYLRKPPKPLVSTIDPYRVDRKQRSVQYRHIEGNWYVYYEFTP